MFTGLVARTGTVRRVDRGDGSDGAAGRLVVDAAGDWERPWEPGESISVSGVCLSLVGDGAGNELVFDVLAETFDKTCLGAKSEGDLVNLERALRFGDAMGGHIVTGHVDGVGRVEAIESVDRDWRLRIGCAAPVDDLLVYKGSICIDGISLTIAKVVEGGFEVHLIPITWEVTSVHRLAVGDPVNLEADVLLKYARQCFERGERFEGPSWKTLEAGWGQG